MKTLVAAIALGLLAAPAAFAGQAEEDTLYHWGECAVVGSMYQAAVEQGIADAGVTAAFSTFQTLEPRMATYVDGLADALGEERANTVYSRLISDYGDSMTAWVEADDRTAYPAKTWGKTMDRCLKEAMTLPAAD
ncbi:MAG: hypothetical protein KF842_09875 [Caulobacter sp.]|nr:hypothetical protein [Caulobacter sp.]